MTTPMMIYNDIKQSYFDWLVSIVIPEVNKRNEYSNLLNLLYNINFIPSMNMDINRLKDGLNLRNRFLTDNITNNLETSILLDTETNPCSLLEMISALSLRIEEHIMCNPDEGDRTSVWFNNMLYSLDIINQTNDCFNLELVMFKISMFNSRSYNKNGYGGLFTIQNPNIDMRELEIWYQMNLYIKEIDGIV